MDPQHLTEDSSLLLHAIHRVPQSLPLFKENHTVPTLHWFEKSLQKNPRTGKLESIHELHFVEQKN
jgi:hypothetical protein